eukprot:TRINITY_DN14662_c0_g1_i4.p1 TRINITY_DN14662_c0_g1~~TRINITY_DN14662_c0_g1_i4.p1  ORF type:complete len:203 (+),score=13.84 TRINITY_DN14662_c0_g1_i4:346-954(+)
MEDMLSIYGDEGFAKNPDLPFIAKPENFTHILHIASEDQLIKFLETISSLLDEFEYNSLLLRVNTDGLMPIVSLVIKAAKEKYSPALYLQLYSIMQKLLKPLMAEMAHYDFVYQAASEVAAKCQSRKEVQSNYKVFEVCANILYYFAAAHSSRRDNPESYLYFAPYNSKIQVSIPKNSQHLFTNVFICASIGLFLYCVRKDR